MPDTECSVNSIFLNKKDLAQLLSSSIFLPNSLPTLLPHQSIAVLTIAAKQVTKFSG